MSCQVFEMSGMAICALSVRPHCTSTFYAPNSPHTPFLNNVVDIDYLPLIVGPKFAFIRSHRHSTLHS